MVVARGFRPPVGHRPPQREGATRDLHTEAERGSLAGPPCGSHLSCFSFLFETPLLFAGGRATRPASVCERATVVPGHRRSLFADATDTHKRAKRDMSPTSLPQHASAALRCKRCSSMTPSSLHTPFTSQDILCVAQPLCRGPALGEPGGHVELYGILRPSMASSWQPQARTSVESNGDVRSN